MQELIKRWDQYVNDHDRYDQSYATTTEWLEDLSQRYNSCIDTTTDKYTTESKLSKLQVCYIDKWY